jgi:hypothetical protein
MTSMRSICSAGTQLVSPRLSRSLRQPMRTELRLAAGLPSIRIRVFSGPMPRRSIWRLLPRWPLVELPVRFTPGMARMISEMSLAGGRFAMSSALMTETPGACFSVSSAVPRTVTSGSFCSACWASADGLAQAIANAMASGLRWIPPVRDGMPLLPFFVISVSGRS